MTDGKLIEDLNLKTDGMFFKIKLFKKDKELYYRRSFDDLFKYYRKLKVTEKQLLKCLLLAGFRAAVCSSLKKTVFCKIGYETTNFWRTPGYGYSYTFTTENTKYTKKYLDNLYNQIQKDEKK